MKFLFIFTDLQVGGIETLILRAAKWLNQNDNEVTVFVSQGGDLISELSKYAKVRVLGKSRYHMLGLPVVNLNIYKKFDVIHAFSYDSAWLGAQISKRNNAKLIVGVYHPKAFSFFQGNPPKFISKYFKLFKSLPDENIFFMNVPTQKSHEEYYGKTFSRSRILPLPIDEVSDAKVFHRIPKKDPQKLVSIGRLVDFKIFHYGVIEAVKLLIDQNFSIEYHIYGDGRLRKDLEEFILQNDLSSVIYLHGEVKYENFQSVVKDAYIFLGMGTSLAEAAIMGIPSLAMPPWDKYGNTFGLFHSLTHYSLGEAGEKKDVYKEIKKILLMNISEYYEICALERKSASEFSTNSVMQKYLSYCKDLRKLSYIPSYTESLEVIFSRLINTRIPSLKKELVKNDLRYQL